MIVSNDSDYVGHGKVAKVLAQKHLDFTVHWELSPTSDDVIYDLNDSFLFDPAAAVKR